jgi:hypothetical protein
MADINVVMLGGKRVGKSSILAGMIEAINHSDIASCIRTKDVTDYSSYNGYTINRKREKLKDLQKHMPTDVEFMTQTMADSKIQRYSLEFQLVDKSGALSVDFYDVPGEFANPNNLAFESEMLPLIEKSDVFIVAIDTPYMMLAPTSVNSALNRIDDLQNALHHILTKDESDLKMVIFVPVKCEKWADQMQTVVDKVKSTNRILIQSLTAYDGMSISIIPVQTVGNIEFDSFHEAKLICKEGEPDTYPCFHLNDKDLRVSNGRVFKLRPPYFVKDDVQAIVDGVNIPNAWYKVNPQKSYSPCNCEQPILHVLRFMVEKTLLIRSKSEVDDDSYMGKFLKLISQITDWWNGIDFDEFSKTLSNLQESGLIKDSGDGIEIIHRYTIDKDSEAC